jgi:hypothetical protein
MKYIAKTAFSLINPLERREASLSLQTVFILTTDIIYAGFRLYGVVVKLRTFKVESTN